MKQENESDVYICGIKNRMKELFITKDMADCEFEFKNNEKIEAHKIILGIASPALKPMFHGGLKIEEGPIKIEDIDCDIFNKMLEFIYTDDTCIDSLETACLLFAAANKYLLLDLKEYCEKYLLVHINTSTIFYLLQFATLYVNKNIMKGCLHFIRSDIKPILDSIDFFKVDVQILKTIAEQPALNIDSEFQLFQAIEKWMKYQVQNEGLLLEDVLCKLSEVKSHIRFLAMESEEYAKGPGLSDLLSTNEKLAISLNLHSPGVLRIPKGICPLQKPRPPRVRYQYRFLSVSDSTITTRGVVSEEFPVKNTLWQLRLVAVPDPSTSRYVRFDVVFLGDVNKSATANLSAASAVNNTKCCASVELKIFPSKVGHYPHKIEFHHLFNVKGYYMSNPFLIEWREFFKEDSLYRSKDQSVFVEASIELEPEPDDEIFWLHKIVI